MGRAVLKILSNDEIYAIHNTTLQILEDVGLKIQSSRVLNLLSEAGANIDNRKSVVKIPEALVKEAIKKAPKTIRLSARNPRYDVIVPTQTRCYLSTDGCGVHMLDPETGERREGTRKDLAEFAVLADALESVQIFWPTIVTSDVPKSVHELHELVTSMLNTVKHVEHEALSAREAQYEIEVASAILGEKEAVKKRPIISAVQCPLSPLGYEKGSIEATVEFAMAGVPVVAMAMPQSGGTGPVTLAGTLALGNAETLGSLIVTQFTNPGVPFIYSIVAHPMDPKLGIVASGAPEGAIMGAAAVQMAKYYGLPCEGGGFSTDAKFPSVQAAFEKTVLTMPVVLAGADIIAGIGGLDAANILCLEQMVIDSEIWESTLRVASGLNVNDETLALDVIRKVGPGGHFLAERHTLRHVRDELWMPKISDRVSYASWKASGEKNIVDVAKERVRTILMEHKPELLDETVREEINQIVKRYEKEFLG
jgi:trimethylamine--corrinoid protein Co-methyltransferase